MTAAAQLRVAAEVGVASGYGLGRGSLSEAPRLFVRGRHRWDVPRPLADVRTAEYARPVDPRARTITAPVEARIPPKEHDDKI